MFKDYRRFLVQPDENWQGTDLFRRDEFLSSLDRDRRVRSMMVQLELRS